MQMTIPHITPWGEIQSQEDVADGVVSVSTAGHGGLYVEPAINETIPDYLRNDNGWYEEDCDWAKAHMALSIQDRLTECAEITLRNWFPDQWEEFTGKTLVAGESSTRDRDAFMARAKDSYLVTAAWGAWKDCVPEGTVTCKASLGGRSNGSAKYFSVSEEEYDARGKFGFIIDIAIHKEVDAL